MWALGIRRCLEELGAEVSLIHVLPCSPTHSFTHYFIPLLFTEYPHVLGGLTGLGTKKTQNLHPPASAFVLHRYTATFQHIVADQPSAQLSLSMTDSVPV